MTAIYDDPVASANEQAGSQTFRPDGLLTSKLRFYSIGICAENKALGSMDVEVIPTEEFPMTDGEVSTNQVDYTGKGTDALGQNYSSKVTSQGSVKATWLRLCEPNRMTAPDVRRGEAVILMQFGDAPKLYWITQQQDNQLRRLETVVYAISASAKEGDPMDADHTYYFEWSTHRGLVGLHTSQANNEPFGYDIQLNTKDGAFALVDSAGNYFSLDSAAQRIEMKNVAGSHWDMNKRNLTVTIPGKVNYDVGEHFTVTSPKVTLDGVTNVTKDTTMEMNTTTQLNTLINGGLTVTQLTGTAPGGKNRMKGNFYLEEGDFEIEQNLKVNGMLTVQGMVHCLTTLKVDGYASLSGGYG